MNQNYQNLHWTLLPNAGLKKTAIHDKEILGLGKQLTLTICPPGKLSHIK